MIGGGFDENWTEEVNFRKYGNVLGVCTRSTDLQSGQLRTLETRKTQVLVKFLRSSQSSVPSRHDPVPGQPDTQEIQILTGSWNFLRTQKSNVLGRPDPMPSQPNTKDLQV